MLDQLIDRRPAVPTAEPDAGLPLPPDACRVRIEADCPPLVACAAAFELTYRIENCGHATLASTPPHPVHRAYRWQRDGLTVPVNDETEPRIGLVEPIAPGATVARTVGIAAPAEVGEYELCLTLVQEGVAWFDDLDPSNAWRQTVCVRAAGPLDQLFADIDAMFVREAELRRTLLAARDAAERQRQELQVLARSLEAARQPAEPPPSAVETDPQQQYQRLIDRVREVVSKSIPPGAVVVVISKGDPKLLELGDRQAWHFPRNEDGLYAGHYPADGAEAVAHLDALQAAGATHLVVPATSFWWLDHYAAFGAYLKEHHRRIWLDEYCTIFELVRPAATVASSAQSKSWRTLFRHFGLGRRR